MKNKLVKIFTVLGLSLLFTICLPNINGTNVEVAQASSTERYVASDSRLNISSVPIVRGKTFTLKVYNLNSTAKVSYKSDNSEIASVNSDGLITANNVGTTTITVTVRDGSQTVDLTCNVTVGPPAFSVTMTRSRIILGPEDVSQLRVIMKPSNTVEDAKFSSYDSSIASLSTGGRITARQLGFTYLFAEIDALSYNGYRKFATCSLIVTDYPSEVKAYFDEHPEVELLPLDELTVALGEFFGNEAKNNSSNTKSSSNALINRLDKFLNERFDNLDELREMRNKVIAQNASNR